MTDTTFISRAGDGFQVRIARKARFFSDQEHGGKDRAFKAAKRYRDDLIQEHKPTLPQEGVLTFVNGKPTWVTTGWHGLSGQGRKGVAVS